MRLHIKVAGDCTLAPDPGGCALSEGLIEEGASSEEGGTRNETCSRKEKGFVREQVGRRDEGMSLRPLFLLWFELKVLVVFEGVPGAAPGEAVAKEKAVAKVACLDLVAELA